MRVDSDVVFLEDPYPILNGPLLSPFALVSQTDIFAGPTRPRCDQGAATPDKLNPAVGSCGGAVPLDFYHVYSLTYLRGSVTRLLARST